MQGTNMLLPEEEATTTSNCGTKHPQYLKYESRWQLVEDVINSDARGYIFEVESRRGLDNLTNEQVIYYNDRNLRYVETAQFVNFTRRTKNSWLGAIFRKEPVIELPQAIEYLREDATGANVTLSHLCQNICGEILEKGRVGLLVDYPASAEGLTEGQQQEMNAKARIYMYKAQHIINWNVQIENGIPVLKLVVLLECNQKLAEDGFTWVNSTQYRVLQLIEDEQGNRAYIQTVYAEDQTTIIERHLPRNFDGDYWDHIPFVFIGTHNNNAEIDPSPLFDIANINIGHLRNSADYEESVHICGQPTLFIQSSISFEQFQDFYPGGLRIGSRRGINLGPDSNAFLLQASPNQLADEAMKRKEEQAQMIGAKFVQPGGTNETAEGVRMRLSGDTSELTIVAINCQDGVEQACIYAQEFMGVADDNIRVDVNTDFIELNIDAQIMAQLTMLMNNGVIAKKDIRDLLRMSGDIDPERTDEEIEQDVNQEQQFINPLA